MFGLSFKLFSIGFTLLIFIIACKGGHLEIVKLLLDNGADELIKDKEGETALFIG